ncbi:MAG: alpha/beta fold hydrolase [Desulfobacterales bacterium]
MVCEQIIFQSDKLLLSGTLHRPEVEHPALVIGCHGLLSSSESPKQIELAKACNALGLAFFRFDHRGCGQSEGLFNEVTSFEGRCNDLKSALEQMRARSDLGRKRGLFGSSMGGAVCLAVAAEYAPSSLVTVAAPLRSRSIVIPEDHSEAFTPRLLQFDIQEKLSKIAKIYIFHGDADAVVPPSQAVEIYNRAGEPKKITLQKNGDHRMCRRSHQTGFVSAAAGWFYDCFYL